MGSVRYSLGVRGPCLVGSLHKAVLAPLLGNWQTNTVVSGWKRPLPKGPLPCYNPSKWNQSGTMRPTVASKRSPRFSLSWVHRGVRLWRPSHLKSSASLWQDKVAALFLSMILMYRQTVLCLHQSRRGMLFFSFFFFLFVRLTQRQTRIGKTGNVPCKYWTENTLSASSVIREGSVNMQLFSKSWWWRLYSADCCFFNGAHLMLMTRGFKKAFLG